MLASSIMLKALINKLLLIYRHVKSIFAALGLHTTKTFIISYASVTVMVLLLCFCIVLHALETVWNSLSAFVAFLFSCSLTFLFYSSGTLWLFVLCCYHSACVPLSQIYFCSSFLHLVDDSLVFELCAFCSMICSCCVTAAAWPLSLLPTPSPPWKPPDFNVRVCLRCPNS